MKDELLKIFSIKIRNILNKLKVDFCKMQEIRLRMNGPLMVIYENKNFVTENSTFTNDSSQAFIITKNELETMGTS